MVEERIQGKVRASAVGTFPKEKGAAANLFLHIRILAHIDAVINFYAMRFMAGRAFNCNL
jgi:hypothetical protein